MTEGLQVCPVPSSWVGQKLQQQLQTRLQGTMTPSSLYVDRPACSSTRASLAVQGLTGGQWVVGVKANVRFALYRTARGIHCSLLSPPPLIAHSEHSHSRDVTKLNNGGRSAQKNPWNSASPILGPTQATSSSIVGESGTLCWVAPRPLLAAGLGSGVAFWDNAKHGICGSLAESPQVAPEGHRLD